MIGMVTPKFQGRRCRIGVGGIGPGAAPAQSEVPNSKIGQKSFSDSSRLLTKTSPLQYRILVKQQISCILFAAIVTLCCYIFAKSDKFWQFINPRNVNLEDYIGPLDQPGFSWIQKSDASYSSSLHLKHNDLRFQWRYLQLKTIFRWLKYLVNFCQRVQKNSGFITFPPSVHICQYVTLI